MSPSASVSGGIEEAGTVTRQPDPGGRGASETHVSSMPRTVAVMEGYCEGWRGDDCETPRMVPAEGGKTGRAEAGPGLR